MGEEARIWAILKRIRYHVRQDNLQWLRFQKALAPTEIGKMHIFYIRIARVGFITTDLYYKHKNLDMEADF